MNGILITYNSIKMRISSQRSVRSYMHSTRRALIPAFIDALLDAFSTEAMTTLWIDICIGKSVEAYGTFEFITYQIIDKIKRSGSHEQWRWIGYVSAAFANFEILLYS
jgi:hypothetical protein